MRGLFLFCLAGFAALIHACGGNGDVFGDPSGTGSAQGGATSGPTGSAQGGAGQGGGLPSDACQALCDTQATLKCPGFSMSECLVLCAALPGAIPWCSDEVLALVDCAKDEPASSFQCNATGGVELVDGACSSEQREMEQCWYQGPPPDLADECGVMCASQMGLACFNPQCEARCNQALASDSPCRGAWGGYVACVAQIQSPMWQCGGTGPQLTTNDCDLQLAILANCLVSNGP